MTPLIQKAARMIPEPEAAIWFDMGQMERWEGGQVPYEIVMNLPFERTGIVGLDQDGKDFALWLTQGKDSVTVAGASMWHGAFMDPFAYIKTDQGLRYYRKDGPLIDQSDVRPMFRMVCAVLLKLADRPSTAYQPVPNGSFINRKRKAKGKGPITFDWKTVEIGPRQVKSTPLGGTHASPRLHDRRGHFRTLRSGKKVWVKACKVGDASRGIVFHDYEVRA